MDLKDSGIRLVEVHLGEVAEDSDLALAHLDAAIASAEAVGRRLEAHLEKRRKGRPVPRGEHL